MMKEVLRSLCISAALTTLAVAGFAQKIEVNQNNRTIAVTATDKAAAEADIATIHIGFEVYGPDSDSAYAAGSQISNAIIDALHKAGVEDKSVQSEAQSVQQNFQFDEKESEIDRAKKRFILRQTWTVKTEAADAAKVLHVAVQAGANASGQIEWEVKDHAGLQAQAAAKALQHAQAMADQMAKGLGVRLGALIYASNQPPTTETFDRLQAFAKLEAPPPPPPPLPLAILPQQIEESATVYAVFAIE